MAVKMDMENVGFLSVKQTSAIILETRSSHLTKVIKFMNHDGLQTQDRYEKDGPESGCFALKISLLHK